MVATHVTQSLATRLAPYHLKLHSSEAMQCDVYILLTTSETCRTGDVVQPCLGFVQPHVVGLVCTIQPSVDVVGEEGVAVVYPVKEIGQSTQVAEPILKSNDGLGGFGDT